MGGVGDWVGVSVWGGEVNLKKEIPLNEISENLKI